jgi:hypothetical protein
VAARVIATFSNRRIASVCVARSSLPSASLSSASGTFSPARSRAPGIRAEVRPSTKTQSRSRPAAASSDMSWTAPAGDGTPAPSSSRRPASATAAT